MPTHLCITSIRRNHIAITSLLSVPHCHHSHHIAGIAITSPLSSSHCCYRHHTAAIVITLLLSSSHCCHRHHSATFVIRTSQFSLCRCHRHYFGSVVITSPLPLACLCPRHHIASIFIMQLPTSSLCYRQLLSSHSSQSCPVFLTLPPHAVNNLSVIVIRSALVSHHISVRNLQISIPLSSCPVVAQ